MANVIEAKAPTGTHTSRRRWENTETRKQAVDTKAPDRLKFSAQNVRALQAGVLSFVSGGKELSTAPSNVETFLVSSPQDQADAIFEAPGADLSDRLQRALPLLALVAPGEEFPPRKVVEWLLNCDILMSPQRVRHSVSISVELPADKWMAQVRAWASSFPQTDHVVDDSRESIYGDRI